FIDNSTGLVGSAPRLLQQGQVESSFVECPMLASPNLQHEDIVSVVMRAQPLAVGGREIGIDLHARGERRRESAAKISQRRRTLADAIDCDRTAVPIVRVQMLQGADAAVVPRVLERVNRNVFTARQYPDVVLTNARLRQ